MGRQVRRPRLLVILGAGSTIHAGAPSTNAITDLVCQIEDEPIRAVVSRLRDQRTEGNFNFETVLAALEELDEFQLRQRAPTAWQRIGGNLSAFAEFLPQFANLGQDSFLIARARLVGRIKNFVMERTANASSAALKADGSHPVRHRRPRLSRLGHDGQTRRMPRRSKSGPRRWISPPRCSRRARTSLTLSTAWWSIATCPAEDRSVWRRSPVISHPIRRCSGSAIRGWPPKAGSVPST